jgi:ATP-dependent exoDNAse (exonuclease V) alpha subunit
VKKELGIWEGDNFVGMKDGIVAMSFTNKASNGIKGTTIHKALQININGKINKKSIKKFKYIKYVVIDEIGMISNKLWSLLKYVKHTYPHLIFILCGDEKQLPPVGDDELDVFNHPIVNFLCHNNMVQLKVPHRFNMPLWEFLNRGYYSGDWSGLNEEVVDFDTIYNSKNICFTNKTRKKINKMCMEHFKGLDSVYLPVKERNDKTYTKYTQDAWLYIGLPIMSYTNNSKLNIINSEEFTVINFDEKKIYIQRDNGKEFDIDMEDFHSLFVVNYCSTTHKAQGETYTCKVLLWEFDLMIKNKKLCYTACSRATDIDNLIICRNLIS